MKICFITFSYSSTSIGGIERYLDSSIKEIIRRGHYVDVVAPSYNESDKIDKSENLTVHNIRIMNPAENNEESGIALYFYIKKLVIENKIDIISAENFYRGTPPSYAFALNLVSVETGIPVVLRMHAHFEKELEIALMKDLMWSKLIGVSKNINDAAYKAGANVKKLSFVYPGIDCEFFREGLGKGWLRERIGVQNNEILILHASRITGSKKISYLESKGVVTLIKSFAILAQTNKNIKLLISAARPPKVWEEEFKKELTRIEELSEVHGIKNRVIVKSFELDEMPHVYNGCDIFVMASQNESFGLVYAEAMACCIPVIGTSVGGIPEIITNNVTGYLVEPNNPVELSKKIDILVKEEYVRKNMGEEGIKYVKQNFELKKMIDRLLGIFSSVIEKKNGRE